MSALIDTQQFETGSLLRCLLENRDWPQHDGVCQASNPAAGVWTLAPRQAVQAPALVLSAGLHGDETAPIELLCSLADDWLAGRLPLNRHLLLCFGNLEAMHAGSRYLDADLNRQFGEELLPAAPREAQRAAVLRGAVEAFHAHHGEILHLDLHSAIRTSHHPCFAIHPRRDERDADLALLAACGIDAVLLAGTTAPTFSAWSTRRLGARAYTFEMGRVRRFGEGRPGEFQALRATLAQLAAVAPVSTVEASPLRYRVTREIRKGTDSFRFDVEGPLENFQPLKPGCLIAHDGPDEWYAATGEHLVFPNPDVKPGLRAALLVVPV